PKAVPAELSDWGMDDEPPAPKPFMRGEPEPPLEVRHDPPPLLDGLPAWSRLKAPASRDDIFQALCELPCARLEFAAVSPVHGPTAVLRVARGLEGPAPMRELSVALEDCGSFRAAVENQSAYLGALDDASRSVLLDLGRRVDQVVFLPIL